MSSSELHEDESKDEQDREKDTHKLLPSHHATSSSSSSEDDFKFTFTSRDKVIVNQESTLPTTIDPNATPPFSWKKLWMFTGPGFLMSIAFLDPGNIEGDLQAGAIAGYSLLWLVVWTTVISLLIQLLSARVGVATGCHLAELCKEEYPNWVRLLLWLMAEVALIAADIQEVIGSAIAIKILSNGAVPLWAGVVITAFDWYVFPFDGVSALVCFFFLFLENYGMRKLEAVFAVFIATMALSFAWMFAITKPNGKELLSGLLIPRLGSNTIRQAVGIVGCVITPHNVFLHSALVQSRDIDIKIKGQVQEAVNYYSIESTIAVFISLVINILVVTVFAKGFYGTEQAKSMGLINAGNFLHEKYGGGLFPIFYIWGIGLLAAGQSSTITGTYAGQFIMTGFLDLRLKKWLRSLITRSFAIVPTIIVVLVYHRSETSLDILNEWLNVLQSMQIPFALIPLLTLVSKEEVMGYFKIGVALERVAWTTAVLVIVINGYLLLEFFISEVEGFIYALIVVVITVGYIAFIIYLLSHGATASPTCST